MKSEDKAAPFTLYEIVKLRNPLRVRQDQRLDDVLLVLMDVQMFERFHIPLNILDLFNVEDD